MSSCFPATRWWSRTKMTTAHFEPGGAWRPSRAGAPDPEGGNEAEKPRASAPPAGETARPEAVVISRVLLDRVLRKLGGADTKIYLALCLRADTEGTAQASTSELARIAGVGVRTVYGSLRRLERAGLVRVEHRAGGITANMYRVFTEPPLNPSE